MHLQTLQPPVNIKVDPTAVATAFPVQSGRPAKRTARRGIILIGVFASIVLVRPVGKDVIDGSPPGSSPPLRLFAAVGHADPRLLRRYAGDDAPSRVDGNACVARLLLLSVKSHWTPSPAAKTERNEQIVARVRAGASIAELAREYGVSRLRIHQLLAEHPRAAAARQALGMEISVMASTQMADLPITARLARACEALAIDTVSDLARSLDSLRNLPNIGHRTLLEVHDILRSARMGVDTASRCGQLDQPDQKPNRLCSARSFRSPRQDPRHEKGRRTLAAL